MQYGIQNQQSQAPGEHLALQPWLDYATVHVPNNHAAVLWWAEYLYTSTDAYRASISRIADHFLTEIDFPEVDTDEENAFRDLFDNGLNYRLTYKNLGETLLAYGNLFVSVHLPFDRRMICRKCKREELYRKAKPKCHLSASAPYVAWNRTKPCVACGDMSPYICQDRQDPDVKKVKIINHAPRDMEMAYNPYTGRKDVWIKQTCPYYRDIQSCQDIFVEDTPLEILEAVARGVAFRFDPSQILHIGIPGLPGLRMRGWGLAPSIACFRSAWLNQMYNRADQAVAADYTLGIRMLSPAPTAGGTDPMQVKGASEFAAQMQRVIKTHRLDPTRIHVAPHAVEYQFLGGEGGNLITPDKLKFRQGEFLNGMGVPVEFYQMSLTTQAAPMALRLFENAWQVVPAAYNQLTTFVIEQVSRMLEAKPVKAVMRRTTIADDSERKAMLGQLMAANQISPKTFLEAFGIDAATEVRNVYKHQEFTAKVQKEFDERQANQQEIGAMESLAGLPTPSTIAQQLQAQQGQAGGALVAGPGDQSGGQGGASPAQQAGDPSITGMADKAEQLAQQLVPMPDAQRKTQLKQIRESSKDLHALVMAAMEKIRSGARSQGQQQVIAGMAQQGQAGGAPAA